MSDVVFLSNETLENISKTYRVTFNDTALMSEQELSHCEPGYFSEYSCCTYDEIWLGIYKDPERRLLAFFHELGHCASKLPDYSAWPFDHYNEAMAWRVGIKISYDLNSTIFSEGAQSWARTELASYFEDENPEKSPSRFLEEAFEISSLSGKLLKNKKQ